jgi:hypothetical protein
VKERLMVDGLLAVDRRVGGAGAHRSARIPSIVDNDLSDISLTSVVQQLGGAINETATFEVERSVAQDALAAYRLYHPEQSLDPLAGACRH